ncbi:hypothetical protein HHK36_001062 [Tetracentron sinense]|uniref:Uncharacterized protein n=1 Tax=Tetracentron sinense TaxID=13715 RepID=A0A835DRA1_TETSI|nr:hypothetical protein HHK36_001062 [Tetracentron sinense]
MSCAGGRASRWETRSLFNVSIHKQHMGQDEERVRQGHFTCCAGKEALLYGVEELTETSHGYCTFFARIEDLSYEVEEPSETSNYDWGESPRDPLVGVAGGIVPGPILVVELLAIQRGLAEAVSKGLRKVVVFSDSKGAVDAINNRVEWPWEAYQCLLRISGLMRLFDSVIVHHVFRETNRAADFLSSFCHRIEEVARLFGPSIFEASKLRVLFLGVDEKKHPGNLPRTYTLTHSDITSKLTLAISQTINNSQLNGWYNRLQRDEVIAEWKKVKEDMSLHVHCHISGGHFLLDLCAKLRFFIFSKELPMVLKAFVHGDENLFKNYPELKEALVWVYFHSNLPEFNRAECWGPLKDAVGPTNGGDGGGAHNHNHNQISSPKYNWVARLFDPAIFEASKLRVLFLGVDEKKHPGNLPRAYTLTHCDITSKLTLAISQTINNAQVNQFYKTPDANKLKGWYNRLQRDEVIAEWKKVKDNMSLHVHCHISGGHFLLDLCAKLRFFIFSKELPVVLKAFVHGDENLFKNYPELKEALVWVYFHSNLPEFNRAECWGPLKDAAALSNGGGGGAQNHNHKQTSSSNNWVRPEACPEDCTCCFPPTSLITWSEEFPTERNGTHQSLQQQM